MITSLWEETNGSEKDKLQDQDPLLHPEGWTEECLLGKTSSERKEERFQLLVMSLNGLCLGQ